MSAPLFVGIDVGSSATKCIVLDSQNSLLGEHVVSSGFDYSQAAEMALARALVAAEGSREDVAYCVSTGYGRKCVSIANRQVTEITCHARGAREWYPGVRNVVDVGGQDTKIIRLTEQGRMTDYRMNAKCAAGTGTFLDSIAIKLGVTLAELDELAMKSTADTVMNSYCTVFTGTEVIERVKDGQPREDISMGLFRSIAMRISEMLSARDDAIALTGGVAAYCRALVRAVEEVMEVEVLLPPMPQHAGAYGAALIALESKAEVKST